MCLFYAYIVNILDHNTWRILLTFADRPTADEWWRAVSMGGNNLLASVQRVTPQFYTHNISVFNIYNFFSDSRISAISEPFKGRLFLTLQNDLAGRGLSIIPHCDIRDHISGRSFYIRSKSNPNLYWALSGDQYQRISTSATSRSLFRVTARNLPEGTVMIRKDQITIAVSVSNQKTLQVATDDNGYLVAMGESREFLFSDFEEGNFVVDGGQHLSFVPSGRGGHSWELV